MLGALVEIKMRHGVTSEIFEFEYCRVRDLSSFFEQEFG